MRVSDYNYVMPNDISVLNEDFIKRIVPNCAITNLMTVKYCTLLQISVPLTKAVNA